MMRRYPFIGDYLEKRDVRPLGELEGLGENKNLMQKLIRPLAPLVVLAACAAIAFYLLTTAPRPERKPPPPVMPVVDVLEVQPVDYQVMVAANGTVTPRTQSELVSQVAGRIIQVAPSFRNGGFFDLGEVLVVIDPAEYELAVANLEAALAGVEARLAELKTTAANLKKSLAIETQQLALAERQFQRHSKLREQGTVAQSLMEESEREFLLRKSSIQNLNNSLQLIPAQRRVLQSELKLKQAQLDTAHLDLARTQVRAPYAGRVLEKRVDVGQSLSKGSVLGTLYAVDYAEIRLAITDREAAFLDLPLGRMAAVAADPLPPVTLSARIGEQRHQWPGHIVRSEGAVDARTRQLFLIAQVADPYALAEGRVPLKVGQFVEASIPGRILEQVFVLPRKAVRADDEVLVITPDERIQRRRLDVVWRDQESVVVRAGLNGGERVSLTALPYAPDGAQVRISGQPGQPGEPPPQRRRSQGAH